MFNQKHELYDQLNELHNKIGLKNQDFESTKYEYLNIHAWDMVYQLSNNIKSKRVS